MDISVSTSQDAESQDVDRSVDVQSRDLPSTGGAAEPRGEKNASGKNTWGKSVSARSDGGTDDAVEPNNIMGPSDRDMVSGQHNDHPTHGTKPDCVKANDRVASPALPSQPQRVETPLTPVTKSPLGTKSSEFVPTPDRQASDTNEVLRRLRRQVRCISTSDETTKATLSTGCLAMDSWLPDKGIPVAGVTEWIGHHESAGATSLSLLAAANHLRSLTQRHARSRPLVVVDTEGTFYPPAAVSLGIAARQMILVRCRQRNDWVWAIDQALRCDAVAGVWAWIPSRLNDRDARRFQLAAEAGNKPALLVRRENVRGTPGFSDVQFHVTSHTPRTSPHQTSQPLSNQSSSHLSGTKRHMGRQPFAQLMRVTLDRCRGGMVGQQVTVWMDDHAKLITVSEGATTHDTTAAVHLAQQLAHPKSAKRSAGGRETRRATDRSDRRRSRRA